MSALEWEDAGVTGDVAVSVNGHLTRRVLLQVGCREMTLEQALADWHDGSADVELAVVVTADGKPDIEIGWPEFIAWIESHR